MSGKGGRPAGASAPEGRPGLAVASILLGVIGLAALPLATILVGQAAPDPEGVPLAGAVLLMVALVSGLLGLLFGLVARGTAELRWLALTGATLGVVPAHVVDSREVGALPPSAVWGRAEL